MSYFVYIVYKYIYATPHGFVIGEYIISPPSPVFFLPGYVISRLNAFKIVFVYGNRGRGAPCCVFVNLCSKRYFETIIRYRYTVRYCNYLDTLFYMESCIQCSHAKQEQWNVCLRNSSTPVWAAVTTGTWLTRLRPTTNWPFSVLIRVWH